MSFRIGSGVDFHQLKTGKELWLGGIKIPHSKGAVGHSDADVLLHAICDALLGALSLGDIGVHFPNTDAQYKNIASSVLLERTMDLIKKEKYSVVNIDSTICLEEPKINTHTEKMRQVIAALTGITIHDISIKATTTEKMGFVGKGKGVIAYATALLKKD